MLGSTQGLYRVITPTGSTLRDLVPAVGGGFRGLVHATGSTKFIGHVRLVPAGVAVGPLVATVGLAVVGQMLAEHQSAQKLDAIHNALAEMQSRADDQERSVLSTAARQAKKVAGYLLDQASIPTISSAAHALGDLDTLVNSYLTRLDHWCDVAEKYAKADHVLTTELLTALVGNRDDPISTCAHRVARTYEALALQAQVCLLEKIAAEFTNPERSLPHVTRVLHEELSTISEQQARLVGLLDELSVTRLGWCWPLPHETEQTLAARTSFSRLARALHAAPDGLPVLTGSNHTVVELAPSAGALSVVKPTEE